MRIRDLLAAESQKHLVRGDRKITDSTGNPPCQNKWDYHSQCTSDDMGKKAVLKFQHSSF